MVFISETMKNKKLKVYCASGWFTPNQIYTLDEIERVLNGFENEINVFYPKKESKIKSATPTKEEKQITFKQNVDNITTSDFMICSTEDKDVGSMMEAGMAYALKRPIIYVNFTLKDKPFNLMLANSCVAVAKTKEQLKEILDVVVKEGIKSKQLNKYLPEDKIE